LLGSDSSALLADSLFERHKAYFPKLVLLGRRRGMRRDRLTYTFLNSKRDYYRSH